MVAWLGADGGFNEGRPIRSPHVGYAYSSRNLSANGEPLKVPQLVGWLREAIAPVEPATPVEPRISPVQRYIAELSDLEAGVG
jgi:hypothetical protein